MARTCGLGSVAAAALALALALGCAGWTPRAGPAVRDRSIGSSPSSRPTVAGTATPSASRHWSSPPPDRKVEAQVDDLAAIRSIPSASASWGRGPLRRARL